MTRIPTDAIVYLYRTGMASGLGMLTEPDFVLRMQRMQGNSLLDVVGTERPAEIIENRPDLVDPIIAPFLVEIAQLRARLNEVDAMIGRHMLDGTVELTEVIDIIDQPLDDVPMCDWCRTWPATGAAHNMLEAWPRPSCGRDRHGFDFQPDHPCTICGHGPTGHPATMHEYQHVGG